MRSSIVRGVFHKSSTADRRRGERAVMERKKGTNETIVTTQSVNNTNLLLRLTFLHGRILSGRAGWRTLRGGGRGGGGRRRATSPLVHLAGLDHPSHLALSFRRAILREGNNSGQYQRGVTKCADVKKYVWNRRQSSSQSAQVAERTARYFRTVFRAFRL